MKIKKLLIIFICLSFYTSIYGQSELHAIETKNTFLGTKYTYAGKRLSSPYALELPLSQMGDAEAEKHFLVFKKSRNTAKIINLVSAGFSLYAFFNRDQISGRSYWITIGSISTVAGFFNIKSSIHLEKAVKKYNNIVSKNKIGLYLDKTPYGQPIIAAGVSHKF